jgi:hypothetical protein
MSLRVLLDDLRRAGVTDLVGETPVDAFAAAPSPVATVAVAAPVAAAKAPIPTVAAPKPAAVIPPAPVFDVTRQLRVSASDGKGAVVVCAAGGYGASVPPLSGPAGKLMAAVATALGARPSAWVAVEEKVGTAAYTPDQATAVRAFLDAQLPPKPVLVMGQAALSALWPGKTLSAARDETLTLGDRPLVATYHPDALLDQPLLKARAWQDMLSLQGASANLTE